MTPISFDQLLDAWEHLPAKEQAALLAVIQRRLAERGRQRVIQEVDQARAEFAAGQAVPASADGFLRDIKS